MVSGDGLTEMYRGIIEQYPVASIEDPFDQVRPCRSLLLLLLLLLVVVMLLPPLRVVVLLPTATAIAQTAAASIINCSQLTSLPAAVHRTTGKLTPP